MGRMGSTKRIGRRAWKRRAAKSLAISAAFAVFAISESAPAQVFNLTSGTNTWNVAGNWTPSGVPNSVGASATFVTPTANQTVNLGAAITVGAINVTNNSAGTATVTFANGTGGSLTLDAVGSGPATIT